MAFNVLILLIAPPLFLGIINRVKSVFSGRKGPPILQLYYDLFKLLKKGAVYSRSTSFIFRLTPVIILGCVLVAGLVLPLSGSSGMDFTGDIILFVYLFALVRFFIIISSLDTASSFEGMGASREAAFGAFSELTMFTVVISLAFISGSLSMEGLFNVSGPSTILLFVAFFIVLLTENSRMPIDDPNTHLELTMVHEVMILDHSGPDLAIMLYASSIKLFIYMAFAVMVVLPNTGYAPWLGALLILLKVACVSVAVGVVESVTARVRMVKIPHLLIASFVVSSFALLIALFVRGRI